MFRRLKDSFTGGAETPKISPALQEAIRAWENNETGINPERRRAIYGDDGNLVEVANTGEKKDPKFAILLNGQKHQVPGDNLTRGLPLLINQLQQKSAALQQWVITSVQMVNYKNGKVEKGCYFLSGYPIHEVAPMLMDNGPIQ